MKSLQELIKLANNPFYIMTEEEEQRLKEAGISPAKKGLRGNAIVKRTGVLHKLPSNGVEITHGTI